ncbi:MAG: M48 family metalloprotease [Alphaproteobacteria bacterium]
MLFFLFFIGSTTSCYANLIRDTELETKLESLLAPLVQASNISSQIKVRIILDSSYNAFVTGDDIIYLHSGLLLEAETLEEVMGVMAHELGHIASGHVARKGESLQKAHGASLLSTALAAAAAIGGSGELAAGLLVGGNDRAARQFYYGSRINEAVADEWALEMLDELEISSDGMAKMMQRLSQQNVLPESHQSEYYRTHPGTKQRLAVYEDHLAKSNFKDSIMAEADYADFNRIVAKLSGYENRPEQTIKSLGQALENNNLSIDERYEAAIAYFRYGNSDAAMRNIQSLILAEPENPYFYELAGEIAFADQKLPSAIEYLTAAFDKSQQAPLIGMRLGRALLATGIAENYVRARDILKIAVAGEPDWPFVRREYAIALGKTGDIATASWQLAEVAFLNGDLQQANIQLKRALEQPNVSPQLKKQLIDLKFLIENAQILKAH